MEVYKRKCFISLLKQLFYQMGAVMVSCCDVEKKFNLFCCPHVNFFDIEKTPSQHTFGKKVVAATQQIIFISSYPYKHYSTIHRRLESEERIGKEDALIEKINLHNHLLLAMHTHCPCTQP